MQTSKGSKSMYIYSHTTAVYIHIMVCLIIINDLKSKSPNTFFPTILWKLNCSVKSFSNRLLNIH